MSKAVKDLVIIPARGGSKGIPGKNIKPLNGRPLIYYTFDSACAIAEPEDICVSTDSDEIIQKVREYGLDVPFKRPAHLATDSTGTYEVLLHAIDFFERAGSEIERIILLQPTSPLRTRTHIQEMLVLYQQDLDMVVSVKETKANPYYNLFEENDNGFIVPSKEGNYLRRQDCPTVYEINGAIYIINTRSLKNSPISSFQYIKKYVMDEEASLDIDTPLDWTVAEAIMQRKGVEVGK